MSDYWCVGFFFVGKLFVMMEWCIVKICLLCVIGNIVCWVFNVSVLDFVEMMVGVSVIVGKN